MDKIDDKWMRIGGVALLSLNLLILDTEGNRRPFFQQALYVSLYILSVFLILETGRSIILRLHKKYPQPGDGKRRFWKTSLFVTVSNQLLITTTFYISHIIRGIPFSRVNHSLNFFLAIFVVSLVLALVQSTLYERYYYFISLRKVEKENEELLRINLQSQFDSLKQQVNPHFLFNSINTVSSLIGKDPGKAVKFLTEMSKVYRYLLRANEEKLSSLQDELNFLDSYFHMLKTRYQTGLNLNIQVGKEFSGYFLPALTLQLLIENAVKHNII
jgi:sensor histidine kinase YesM